MKRCRYWRLRIPEAIYGELCQAAARWTAISPPAKDAPAYDAMAAAVRKMEPGRPRPPGAVLRDIGRPRRDGA
jgi:hypothetical protein